MRVQQKVEFWYTHRFFPESQAQNIDHREPRRVECPTGATCFRFYDLRIQTATKEDGTTFETSERENESPMYYPGASILSIEEAERREGKDSILVQNMRTNGWDRVIFNRNGGAQPYEDGKTVLV